MSLTSWLSQRGPTIEDVNGAVPLYGLDIETDTSTGGLDPTCSAIVAVAVSGTEIEVVLDGPEPQLLKELDDLIRQLDPGVIVTWNGGRFDLPFIERRAANHGVPMGLELIEVPLVRVRPQRQPTEPDWTPQPSFLARWHEHGHLDGYRLFRSDAGQALGLSCGLKNLARLVGLDPVEVNRSEIHLMSDQELAEYVASDARIARQLVERRLSTALRAVDRMHSARPNHLAVAPDHLAVAP